MYCGGVSDDLETPTPGVIEMANAYKGEAEQQLSSSFQTWEVVGFSTQVVAGTNFWIKINAGDQHIHLKVWKKLSGETQVIEVEGEKRLEDAFV